MPGAFSLTTIIIGAGIAGLACARRIADAGQPVIVLDKGRGLGGRLATRRTGFGSFDHGAQYVTARDPGFAAWLTRAGQAGRAGTWERGGVASDWWVGTPGMSALVRTLADGLDIRNSRHVTRIARGDAGWRVFLDDAAATLQADRLVLAIPAPQARVLLTGVSALAGRLDAVTIAPCWTLMLSLAEPLDRAPDAYKASDGACAWVARDSSKPGRKAPGENWVIQAGPAWSAEHLEDDPDTIAERLTDAFRDWAGELPAIRYAAAHRWRYARVTRALGEPCLWDLEARLGLAGDWCLGPRVEAAYLSGHALAAQVLDG